jgi:hypothetical protein
MDRMNAKRKEENKDRINRMNWNGDKKIMGGSRMME